MLRSFSSYITFTACSVGALHVRHNEIDLDNGEFSSLVQAENAGQVQANNVAVSTQSPQAGDNQEPALQNSEFAIPPKFVMFGSEKVTNENQFVAKHLVDPSPEEYKNIWTATVPDLFEAVYFRLGLTCNEEFWRARWQTLEWNASKRKFLSPHVYVVRETLGFGPVEPNTGASVQNLKNAFNSASRISHPLIVLESLLFRLRISDLETYRKKWREAGHPDIPGSLDERSISTLKKIASGFDLREFRDHFDNVFKASNKSIKLGTTKVYSKNHYVDTLLDGLDSCFWLWSFAFRMNVKKTAREVLEAQWDMLDWFPQHEEFRLSGSKFFLSLGLQLDAAQHVEATKLYNHMKSLRGNNPLMALESFLFLANKITFETYKNKWRESFCGATSVPFSCSDEAFAIVMNSFNNKESLGVEGKVGFLSYWNYSVLKKQIRHLKDGAEHILQHFKDEEFQGAQAAHIAAASKRPPKRARTSTQENDGANALVALKPVGLKNNHNSCYINSVLQCLTSSPAYMDFIESVKRAGRHTCHSNACKVCLMSQHVEKVEDAKSRGLACVSPDTAVGAGFRQDAPFNETGTFGHPLQQDAQDFYRHLVDGIGDAVAGLEAASGQQKAQLPGEIASVGEMKETFSCNQCGEGSQRMHPFHDIQLPIVVGDLEHNLKQYFKPESIMGDWRCENPTCKYQIGLKKFKIAVPPQLLTIHLKRFETSGRHSEGTFERRKNEDHVNFPERLDLTPWLEKTNALSEVTEVDSQAPNDYHYQLRAVVVHKGQCLQGEGQGHYIAYVNINGKWFLCDDASVTQGNLNDVLNAQAYLLFYEKTSSGGGTAQNDAKRAKTSMDAKQEENDAAMVLASLARSK